MPLSKLTGNSFNATANTNIDNGLLFLNPTTNRVGIGNTNPGQTLTVQGTANANLFYKQDSSSGEVWGLNVLAQFGTARFGTFSSYPAMANGSSTQVYCDTNNNRFTLTGGMGGIQFPSTQIASADANTLDDYEEGTWTPTFGYSISNGSMSISYNNNTGWYTKIGNLVYFRLDMRLSSFSKGTASGYPRIVGLPFNPVNSAGYGAMQVSSSLYNWTFSSQPILSVSPSGNPEISLFRMVSNGVPVNLDDPDGDAFIWVSGCYVVS